MLVRRWNWKRPFGISTTAKFEALAARLSRIMIPALAVGAVFSTPVTRATIVVSPEAD